MSSSEEPTFEQTLETVERSLFHLKERYAQVQRDQQQQTQLQQRQAELKTQGKSAKLKLELQEIEQQLEELETNLESRLFSWSGLKEVFWQAVRFGGVGIAIGWSMAFFTLKSPAPTPTSPLPSLSRP